MSASSQDRDAPGDRDALTRFEPVEIGPKPFSFPPTEPRWTPVSAASLGISPYTQICHIRAKTAGQVRKAGTGWLCRAGVIATAAHVLAGADRCEIRWAASSQWHEINAFTIHPDFTSDRIGSDVALRGLWPSPRRLIRSARLPGNPGQSERWARKLACLSSVRARTALS